MTVVRTMAAIAVVGFSMAVPEALNRKSIPIACSSACRRRCARSRPPPAPNPPSYAQGPSSLP